jgi:chromosome segregation ATPase
MSLEKQFNTINDKLQLLLKQQLRLKRENEQLREELKEEKRREQGYLRQIDLLENAVAILKLSTGDMDDREKKEFEKKISQYIRDIDKVIAYLSQ